MNKQDVIKLLEANKNERGLAHWKHKELKSFGLGLTQIKKLAKQVGKNHELALELFDSDVYDAKVLSTIIEEPKKVTREQIDQQIKHVFEVDLAHCYVGYLLSRLKWAKDLAREWCDSTDDDLRRLGYSLLYHVAKDDKKIPDNFFEPYLKIIEKECQSSPNMLKNSMNGALLMIGQRSPALNKEGIRVAKKIGKVEVDYGDNSCEAPDALAHLSKDSVQKKIKTFLKV